MADPDDVPPELERRVSALEQRMDVAESDARAARHLAAAGDRDLADLGMKVEANRRVINALGLQLNGRLDQVDDRLDQVDDRLDRIDGRLDRIDGRLDRIDGRFEQVDGGFTEMRGRFDAAAAGQQTIVDLLTRLIDEPPAD